MSVDLSKLVVRRRLSLDELNGRRVAIDAYNAIYQFLSIIRQPDGTPLMDSDGRVTSHLSGLFYRTIELVEHGIAPVYVFDGIPSMLKQKTIEARMRRRDEAYAQWQEARAAGNAEAARIGAQASTRITRDVVESAERLLTLMGIPSIAAPSEGEAQASRMCRDGIVYAVASQDYDTLLFGAPVIVRNLSFSGRRKLPRKDVYISVEPELVNLGETLSTLGVTHRQLVYIGIMLGTDFNAGIKGIGPKTALKIARASDSIESMVAQVKAKSGSDFELDPNDVLALFEKPEVNEVSASALDELFRQRPDRDGIIKFMCGDHGFSADRVEKFADRLVGRLGSARQSGIGDWMK
ncbi:MAG: flap endonuclease-1 [Candidatus Marsarchaeota archaeon]|jgi:flap endonuclease-1|nr:flap endonuclease-1 [Candidatus Marsarchaeota archaeon]